MSMPERSVLWQHILRDHPMSLDCDDQMITDHYAETCNSPAMQQILTLVLKLQSYKTPVFLAGEPGVGKNFWAQVIHRYSPSGRGPFVSVDADHVPQEYLEYLLFGDQDEEQRKILAGAPGKIKEALGGTLYISEVQYLPLQLQERLLYVIQKREMSVNGNGNGNGNNNGNDELRTVMPRIMVGTTKKPDDFLRNGSFRRDLFYRLSVFPMLLPPLRQRPEDIAALLLCFLRYYSSLFDKRATTVDSSSLNWVRHYFWPGNLDELREFVLLNIYSAPRNDPQIKLLLFPELADKENFLRRNSVVIARLESK